MSKGKGYFEELDEATRVRPKADGMRLLRETLEAMDALAENQHDKLEAGTLRILIEMHDKLPVRL